MGAVAALAVGVGIGLALAPGRVLLLLGGGLLGRGLLAGFAGSPVLLVGGLFLPGLALGGLPAVPAAIAAVSALLLPAVLPAVPLAAQISILL